MLATTQAVSKGFYTDLTKRFTRMYRFQHAASILSWDSMVHMPPGGAEARAAASAELDVLIHSLLTDSQVQPLLEAAKAEQESLTSAERANLREMEREWRRAAKLPSDHVERKSLATSRAEEGWRSMRQANDWEGFVPLLSEVLEVTKRHAGLLQAGTDLTLYEALLDQYEPGVQQAEIDALFADVKSWLPELLQRILAKGVPPTLSPQGPFPIDKQKELGLEVMKTMLFDFNAGRLDVAAHPFCGGVSEDVRLTTRYYESDFDQSLMGIIHETGHAKYEQNRPKEFLTQPGSAARSMGMHESQSLFMEMQIGRGVPFLANIVVPLLKKYFGDQDAFKADNIAALYHRVRPGKIRVDADEVCYPLHVILRYEIETSLISGTMAIADIPGVWKAKMKEYLGVEIDDYKDGCMQDIHWAMGAVGYFPTYTLGAMYAAQFMAAMRRDFDVDGAIAQRDFTKVNAWLQERIWSRGSLETTENILLNATGEKLNPLYYRRHLEARYLKE